MSRKLFPFPLKLFPFPLLFGLMAGTAMAEVPRVAVDVAPVHSLVARVMAGVGEPGLIIQPGGSPHEYNLRPSEAALLQEADIVVWVGPDLTPWMEDAVATLSGDAAVLTLMEAEGTALLPFREGALFEAHDHGGEEHGHEDHGHDDHAHDDHGHDGHAHDDHGHDEHAHDDHGHDEHAHDAHGHDDHGHDHVHGASDPHVWLSPANAALWLDLIAARLSSADPANAGAYFANAAAGKAEIDALVTEIAAILDPVRGGRFVVFHDAYQYFEAEFGFPASGAISLSDASDPSPARIAEIQARVAEEGIACVLSEPQFNPGIVAVVMEGTAAQTAVIDPLGSALAPGAELYPAMMRAMAEALAGCL
ncbi:zinc ABC transporter substrate-binding protein [Roseicyclus marinus]|uniref:zinc ABC transporter substrate-binding protein n=1 Tax=Roseicyclus marinus TaxID=2161673 RepID=UPI0024101F49|nr:zinc ABC transporter substrate-binding protein [Roseicyclus marinus]MDG3040226.1 zinc ABC transporter substrate-binding protein [Roseicyclus marinus]